MQRAKKVQLKIFTDAMTTVKAEKVLSRATEKLAVTVCDVKIEPYHKGGFVCSCSIELPFSSWPEIVLSVISIAQIIGRAWTLTGDINTEVEMWSNESVIIGVKNLNVFASVK